MQYVSILSPGFSGSTLLSMILCGQLRTIGFGDTYFGPHNNPENICNCGVPFTQCKPRLLIEDAIRLGLREDFSWAHARPVPTPVFWPSKYLNYWPLRKSLSLPLLRKISPNLRSFLFKNFYDETRLMIDGLNNTGDYDFYIDGSKVPTRLELLRTAIPNIKVIHMVRHPGAILYRYHKLGIKRDESGIRQWKRYHLRANKFNSLLRPDHYMVVSYESIVQKPNLFLPSVRKFIGMNAIQDEDPRKLYRDRVHIIGNRMRKTADYIENMSESWRQYLPKKSQLLAESAIEDLDWIKSLYSN